MVELCNATAFDHVRFVFSILLLLFSMTVTSYAIFQGKTGFWDAVPGPAAFILFAVDLTMLGIVEGLQIALVELKRQHPDSYKRSHPRAYQLGQVASKKDNVERFLMGRQVFVVFLVFFIAKLTTVKLTDLDDFLFPVPEWFYVSLLETGFLTCILVVIVAQLMPQIVASKYPVHFLNFWLMKPAYYACIAVETTGITHACWILSYLMGRLSGMKSEDDVLQHISKQKKTSVSSQRDIETGADDAEEKIALQREISTIQNNVTSQSALQGIENILNDATNNEAELANGDVLKVDLSDVKYSSLHKFNRLVTTLDEEVDPDIRKIIQFYLDSHPEQFQSFPSVIGNKVYPPPQAIAEKIKASGAEVPGFLRDISDPNHVPPHIVACELLVHITELQNELRALRQK